LPVLPSVTMPAEEQSTSSVKCVVWDLDNTLWRGVYLENDDLVVDDHVRRTIATLDERGILHSIASRNPVEVLDRVAAFGLAGYFLYPQVGWGEKTEAIVRISESLRIPLDALLFIDDDDLELAAMRETHPQVRCCSVGDLPSLIDRDDLNPSVVSDDARNRRSLYRAEELRARDESAFTGAKIDFLRKLGMRLTIRRAAQDDLDRAAELTLRTHQLNTTGIVYSREELDAFLSSPQHHLLVCTLDDVYGTYGTIGLVMLRCTDESWTIDLLSFSCRVLSRNVAGTVVRTILQRAAQSEAADVRVRLVPTDRNRPVVVTFRLLGFSKLMAGEEWSLYRHDLKQLQPRPDYIDIDECW